MQLPPPPRDILKDSTLFLDLDGTLLDIAERPDDVAVEPETRVLLEALARTLEGRIAIVSGRSLEQLDAILGDCATAIALSGSHGVEHRWNGIHARPERPGSLDAVAERLHEFARHWPGVIIEEKSFGVGLHYRMAPAAEEMASALAGSLAGEFGLHLQRGKMVVELRVGGRDKGAAVASFMRRAPMAGTLPLFAGDDLTDEPAFSTVRDLGGHGILIGEQRATSASYGLPSPKRLRQWLMEAIQ
ncbi:MAG: trehalose-phosphatase [Novosphingobium sp.]